MISVPSGYYQDAPIHETFTVTNESGAPASIRRLIVAVLDPYNVNYDEDCAPTGLALSARQSYSCDLSQPWGSAGTYTMWADWQDYNGHWHQGQLGPNQTLTLAAADAITTTNLPSGTVGKPYAATLAAEGGTAPCTWTFAAGSLPAGLTLSPSGKITGNPAAAMAAKVAVKVTGSSALALTARQTYSIAIAKAPATTALKLSAKKVVYGHEETEGLSVAVTLRYRGRNPAGTVTIKTSAKTICTIILAAGHGTCHLRRPTQGRHLPPGCELSR